MTTHLVIGASGLLGQALLPELHRRGHIAIGASRRGPDYDLDITIAGQVNTLVAKIKPDVIWNAAAIVSLSRCEEDPGAAYIVNARAVALLAEAGSRADARLVHVSTDHFYTGDQAAKHAEVAPIRLINEYARTKFAGERFGLEMPGALILRTNITGFRMWPGQPTFAEWVFEAVEKDSPMVMYDDFYTSTLDAATFSIAACDLLECGATGLINLSASEVANKQTFIEAVAKRLDRTLTHASTGSVRELRPQRGESLGLDVSRAEGILGYRLPELATVVDSLVSEYRGLQ